MKKTDNWYETLHLGKIFFAMIGLNNWDRLRFCKVCTEAEKYIFFIIKTAWVPYDFMAKYLIKHKGKHLPKDILTFIRLRFPLPHALV